jgi:uncharacterized protein
MGEMGDAPMKRFRRLLFTAGPVLALLGAAVPRSARAQQAGAKDPKVVWHVDFADPRRLSALIQNVNNMVTTYQGELIDYDVRIVFLAGGIRFVTEDPLANTPFAEDAEFRRDRPDLIQRLKQLRALHKVKLEYCTLTIDAIGLPKERILPGVTAVRSGVVRVAELQSQGYAYLKVG